MLTRRILMLAAGALPGTLVRNALAQTRRVKPGAHGKAEADAAEQPATNTVATPVGPLDVAARWAYIVDYNTGAVLLDKDSTVEMPPSSMTKLMTLYIVFSQLAAGKLQLDQTVPVSERAWRMGGSKMFVQVGDQVKVEDLLRGIIVDSGNDACIVLAEAVAGSEEGFVEQMNQQAKVIGLTASVFRNTTGWPDPEHHMCCRDIATLARLIIEKFGAYYHYFSEKDFRYNNIDQENRNILVQKGLADGLKTGHTDAGGFGEVATTERNGRRVILVVNGLPSMHARAEESERLLEWSFREYENVTLFSAADTVEEAPVWLGTARSVPLVGGRDLVMTMPRNWRQHASVSVQYQSPLAAPINRGDKVGRIVVSGPGVPAAELPLLAGADVPRLSLPGRALAVLSHFVTGS